MRIAIALILSCVGFFSVSPAHADAQCADDNSVTANQATTIANLLPRGARFFEYYPDGSFSSWKTLNNLTVEGSGSGGRQIYLDGVGMPIGQLYYYARDGKARNLALAIGCSVDGVPTAFDLAPSAPIDRSVPAPSVDRSVPWIDRADTALRAMLNGKSGPIVAANIQSFTHSLGQKPRLKSYSIHRMGNRISMRISTDWQGSVMTDARGNGKVYTTDVVWEFSEGGHVRAKVISDSSWWGAEGAQSLDDWFRDALYPVLYQNAGG